MQVIANSDGKVLLRNGAIITDGGITPSGTKHITSNGTHDVTAFASAEVSVISLGVNTEVSIVNVVSFHTTEFTLLNSTAVRDNFASPNLSVFIQKISGDTATVGTVWLTYCGSVLLNNESYGYRVANGSNGRAAMVTQDSPVTQQYSGAGGVYVQENGNVQFVAASPRVRAGDYIVVIRW